MIDKLAIKAIRLYQQNISPRKGYCCAHNALHNDGSCSTWAISVIVEKGVLTMLSQLGSRFSECSEASKEINKKKNKKESTTFSKSCDAGEIGCCALSYWPGS
ncbi:MAG: membrane protein insertion efficiency factor YidD [Candidatus Thiodiazotropha endolucinida]|nr:membrane protein insertion efficiency factor YidD [Candidatus Thiodiazotropha taylori]MCW4315632.1 membrane protein insertion efficiency factor YidD [Candidatus Thiodiazotropha taylori]